MHQIYLDNAATTSMDPLVIDEMTNVMKRFYGNASSIHQHGAAARDLIEDARLNLAKKIGAQPSEVFFISGATEGINTIIHGAVNGLKIKHIITSPIEHPAVIETVHVVKEAHKVMVSNVHINELGHIDLSHLEKLTAENPNSLVILMHANNEIGNLLPLKKVSEICKRNNSLFFSDMVQSFGKLPIDFSHTHVDFSVGSAHKFHGPKGIGYMYIRGGVKINPYFTGGPQERNMRAGTENIAGIAGLSKAFDIALQNMDNYCREIHLMKNTLIQRITSEIPDAIFHGDKEGLYSILNVGLPKVSHNKMIIFNLDVAGISVSGGSACSSGVMNISHVIKALGKADDYIPIRISLSKFNKPEEIDRFVDLLKKY